MEKRSDGFVFSTPANDKPPDDGGGHNTTLKQQKTSFQDMVMGHKEAPPPRRKIDLIKEKLASIKFEDDNPLKPMVHIEDSVFEGLCSPWQDALVVKLLGKSIGYHTMKDRLHRLWKLVADFDIMDIGNGYFMVKFDNAIDRWKVMDGGPWMIFDHYLTVQCWSPAFISLTAKIDRTMVWIRFPGLNLFYYDESILLALAAAVGRPIKVDSNTLDVRRGRFARVCIEIDLNKPVVGKVWLRGHWYKVEYEGLHRICSVCCCYGHLGRDCKGGKSVALQAGPSHSAPVAQAAGSKTVQSQPLAHGQTAVQGEKTETVYSKSPEQGEVAAHTARAETVQSISPQIKDADISDVGGVTDGDKANHKEEPLHGDWLVVKKKNRKNNPPKPTKSGQQSNDKKGASAKNSNSKSHVVRDTLKSHAKKPQVILSSRDPRDMVKNNEASIPILKHKRQRPDNDSSPGPSMPRAQGDPHPNSVSNNPPNVVYNLGHGAKSAVAMQAISNNHFILLYDDVNADPKKGSTVHVESRPLVQQEPNQEMVPETQCNMEL